MSPTVPPSTLGVVALEKARVQDPKALAIKFLPTSWGPADLKGLFEPAGAWTFSSFLLG